MLILCHITNNTLYAPTFIWDPFMSHPNIKCTFYIKINKHSIFYALKTYIVKKNINNSSIFHAGLQKQINISIHYLL